MDVLKQQQMTLFSKFQEPCIIQCQNHITLTYTIIQDVLEQNPNFFFLTKNVGGVE